ncbi:DUF881 domain-containing protein [Carbonactinospora thermoautotrophica]|nr:DUF881 domain-containing protein [Carbonactinospora thermoautotrophica]MCX9192809.1 DUF881 domain-containing protein [Carbonactinospora thermoautotrophica]
MSLLNQSSETRAGRPRPDESMSLLNQFMENSIEEGYAEAARHRTGPPGRAERIRATSVMLGAVVILGLLMSTSYYQVQQNKPVLEQEREALIQRIEQRTETADELQQRVEALRNEVDRLQESALNAANAAQREQRERLEVAAGAVPVSGPGVRVIVEDAKGAGADGDNSDPRGNDAQPDLGRVLDSDVQKLVNALWLAGAEAIAINGQRLTSLSAIRSAGEAILVDFRPLSPPYRIEAIGNPKTLEARFMDGPGGGLLYALNDEYDIRYDVQTEDELRLPAASSTTLDTAQEKGTS